MYDIAKTLILLREKIRQNWDVIPSDIVVLVDTLIEQLESLLENEDCDGE